MHILHIIGTSRKLPSMKVYFTSSTAELFKYLDNYYAIRNWLVDNGHVITRDMLPRVERQMRAGETDLDIKKIYEGCVEGIRKAELVIVEDTVSNFSTGHQITLALRYRKPTLVLWQGKKHHPFKQMLIHGIDSDILQVSEYTLQGLPDILQIFVNRYENGTDKSRFHLILSGTERSYLDWAQFVKGRSRTQVIRSALQDTIRNDTEYETYLLHKSKL
jgi:hypothetical protein